MNIVKKEYRPWSPDPGRVSPSHQLPVWDFEWSQIPAHSAGRIIEIARRPHGRLLGGSGHASTKPSKLQALAAQRRKEQEERKKKESPANPESKTDSSQSCSSIALLDKLGNRKGDREVRGVQDVLADRKTVHASSPLNRYKRQRIDRDSQSETPIQESKATAQDDHDATYREIIPKLRSRGSGFAHALSAYHNDDLIVSEPTQYRIVLGPPFTDTNPFAGPSPDDVVLAAQSKQKQPGTKKKQNESNKDQVTDITKSVAATKLEEVPKVKSKNLNVPVEFENSNHRGSTNFVVIGHVDHGKSTLMGRLLFDLKHPSLTQRDFNKLQKASSEAGKSSFALAWAMDSTEEERSRGVTIDIATNHFSTDETNFTILDAPGHRDFIPNMIGGTSQADFAVLVVDASVDAFEAGLKGQTREHALLARSIGITKIIVAVNKMDAAKWSQDRFNEITAQLSGFFTAAGFGEKNVRFIPCAGLTGENVVSSLPSEHNGPSSWYKGPTLIQALESSEPARRRIGDPLRLTISDVFRNSVPGVPTGDVSVMGRIDAGNLQVGTVILAQPMGESGSVKGIEVKGEACEWAVAGQMITLHLVGIEQEHLRSGDVICEKGNTEIQNVVSFTAKCLAFEHLLPGPVDCHRGRMYAPARISRFIEMIGKDAGTDGESTSNTKKRKPRLVKPQQVVRLQVDLEDNERGLPLEPSDRVVLRQEGKTVTAGLIDGINGYVSK